MAKTKKDAPRLALLLSSEEAMIGALNRLLTTRLDLAARRAAHEQKIAQLNADFEADPDIVALADQLAGLETSVQLYCINNRAELFPGEKKSRDFTNAVVGFRDNPHAVGKVLKGDSDEAIAERMVEIESLEGFVKLKLTLDKKALLTKRAELEQQHGKDLAKAGIKFTQDETFFIEPKSESLDRITKPAEAAVA